MTINSMRQFLVCKICWSEKMLVGYCFWSIVWVAVGVETYFTVQLLRRLTITINVVTEILYISISKTWHSEVK